MLPLSAPRKITLLCGTAVVAGYLLWCHMSSPQLILPEEEHDAPIYVLVEGQVAQPGVAELPQGATALDAVQARGGTLEGAVRPDDTLPLTNGAHLYIASVDDPPRIDLNQITREQLDAIDGINSRVIENILTYRDTFGPFLSPEELLLVEGVGEKTYEKILPHIIVGPIEPSQAKE
ncbi:MAG: helix-hairpin-helix domain-containing protein [Eubacteriales bacterium]|jgi:competence protein ComEA